MLINKRRFSTNTFIDSFGEGLDERNAENRCSYLHRTLLLGSALHNLVKPKVIEMAQLTPEETLHDNLRRYFDKVSKAKTRQFAEQREVSNIEVIPNTRSSIGSGN